jgi:hypothetical protein
MMSGISLHTWHGRARYGETLLEQVERGCRVQVLIMDEENPALGQMLNDAATLDLVQREIRVSLNRWRDLEAKYDLVKVRTVKRGIVYQQSTLNESKVAYTPYYYSFATSDSPTFVVKSTSPIYKAQKNELDRLWKVNAPAA